MITIILSYHAVDCGVPLVNRNVKLNYSSTLEGSVLTLTCENEILIANMNTTGAGEEILHVTCHSNGNWIPSPADFIQSCTTVSPTTGTTFSLMYMYTYVLWL
jgi:hypothetical protein